MSKFNKSGKRTSPMAGVVAALRTSINEGGDAFASSAQTAQLVSLESLQPHEYAALGNHVDSLEQTIKADFSALRGSMESSELGGESEDLLPHQLEAGAIVAMAAGNPVEYAQAATRATGDAGQDDFKQPILTVDPENTGAAGSLDFRNEVALESFDERELQKFLPYSIAFNVQASRQDEFSETFYPTIVVPPEQGGLDITVRRTMIYNAVHHASSGKAINFQQRNLVEAAVDATVLADDSLALVPFVQPDGSNASVFVDPAKVAPTFRKIAGVDVKTAPLLFGQEVDLIGLSGHPALLGAGIFDHTDAVDGPITLDKIYLQTADVGGDILQFDTQRLPSAGFIKTVEGLGREMELRFKSDDLILNASKRAVDGSVPASLAAIATANYTVRLAVRVSGEANVQFGNVNLWSNPVTVSSIQDVDGNEISTTAGAGLAIVNSLKTAKLLCFDLKANRTGSNRRTRGLLLDTQEVTRRFSIPLGAPISAPSPTGSNRDARDLEALISAARVRNSNMAVTRLLNYAGTLNEYVKGAKRKNSTTGAPAVEGMGGYLVKPFFEEHELDLVKAINSLRDMDRATDVSSLIVNAIRDVAYRMYRDSEYQPALNASASGSQGVKLLIGTDVVLPKHMIVSGDTRTFGIAFQEHAVVSSFDSRMENKIVLALTRSGVQDGADPLSFGNHAWIPELVSTLQVSRDGATYPEAMVQQRNLHINHMPVMAVINVKGLSEVLNGQVTFPVSIETPVTP